MIYEKILLDVNDKNVYLEIYAAEKTEGFVKDALLIMPGGGYYSICSEREGEAIALEFLQKGMVCFVLHYSVDVQAKFPKPLIDASKAMKYIKDNAKNYNINPERVFVMGFSAGGHLAASLGVLWHKKEIYDEIDMLYGYNRPTGILPIYPVISGNVPTHKPSFQRITGNDEPTENEIAEYSLELHVDEKSSPAFICHTSTDEVVSVFNALCFANAYADANIPFEMHIFKEAPHGIALANKVTECGNPKWVNKSAELWPTLAKLWMEGIN